jgi:hypothetical protein
MKKIIILCLQLLIVISFFSSLDVYSQNDSYIDIGSARIRFDADSNKIRFGKRPLTGLGNLKLAKEFNGALFDFKGTHFLWSATDGLTLQDPLSHDSVWADVFAVTRDTGDGEFIPLQRRLFSLKKRFWGNGSTLWDNFLWHYYSYNMLGVLAAHDSASVINDGFMKTNEEQIGLSNSYADKDTIELTYGKWLINCNVSFTFIDNTMWMPVQDSIFCRLSDGTKIVPGSTQYATLTYEDHGRTMGMSGQLVFSVIIDLTATARTYYLQMKTETLTSSIHFGNKDNITCTKLR